jgi:hypothetical protein
VTPAQGLAGFGDGHSTVTVGDELRHAFGIKAYTLNAKVAGGAIECDA